MEQGWLTYRMFSNFLAEQKAVQSRQLGIYGSQPEPRRNIWKLWRLIRACDRIQNGGILASGRDTTWLEELSYQLFLLWWRRWKSQINNLFHGRFIRVAKSPTRSAVPRHFRWGWISVGHLLGVWLSGRVADLGTAGMPSWLSMSTRCGGGYPADNILESKTRNWGKPFFVKIGVWSYPI